MPLYGGVGGNHPQCPDIEDGGTQGGSALSASRSNVALYESLLIGGSGGIGLLNLCTGGRGGDGVDCAASTVLAMDSDLRGGAGGCNAIPGKAGAAVVGAGGTAKTLLAACALSAPAGCGAPNPPLLVSSDGAPIKLIAASYASVAIVGAAASPSAVLREAERGQLEVEAPAGARVWLALAPNQA